MSLKSISRKPNSLELVSLDKPCFIKNSSSAVSKPHEFKKDKNSSSVNEFKVESWTLSRKWVESNMSQPMVDSLNKPTIDFADGLM